MRWLACLVLAGSTSVLVGFVVYLLRDPSDCLDSYPPICGNAFNQSVPYDQPVWLPVLVAAGGSFVVVCAVSAVVARRWRRPLTD